VKKLKQKEKKDQHDKQVKSEKKMEKSQRIQTNLKHVRDEFRFKCDEVCEKHKHLSEKTDKKQRELFL